MNSNPQQQPEPLLCVRELTVRFTTAHGNVEPVRRVSLHVDRGETVGLVGESGAGKSVIARAIMGILQPPGRIADGEILWKGRSILGEQAAAFARNTRGKEVAIVLQDAMTALDPVFTVGMQITEVLTHHLDMPRRQALDRAVELLDLVGFAAPRRRLDQYPHEFSGGMRQRVSIAMALACEPELLIADEPTSSVDVTIQAQILDLIAELQQRLALSVLLITHDMGVIASLCHRIDVMYGGRIVESGLALDVFDRPAHPYTAGLFRSTPRLDVLRPRLLSIGGVPPDVRQPPSGCAFHPRCPITTDTCTGAIPSLVPVTPCHAAACWHPFSPAWQAEALADDARD
jgi:peptide/nickel transport system ATP-binding protein